MDPKIEAAHAIIAEHLTDILALFKPGALITVLVRRPGEPNKDFMLGNDDPDEVITMIKRRVAEESSDGPQS